ncbi:MAG TPA: YfiR family protein [Lacipirellula sp.]
MPRLGWATAALIVWAGAAGAARAQSASPTAVIDREYAIKAAFLYHFCTYVEWPAEAAPQKGEPFVIGIFFADPFEGVLEDIARSKQVNGHAISIRRLTTTDEIAGCHLLFIPRSTPPEQQEAVLRAIRGQPLLVVGEADDFITRGGGAQFFIEGNKVRFAFNADVTQENQLKISSKLLSLAKIVGRHVSAKPTGPSS